MAIVKVFAKVALLLLLAVTVCLIVGIATPYWVSNSGHTSGLWQSCYYETHGKTTRICHNIDTIYDSPNWIKAVRALEILACLGGLVGFFIQLRYLFKNDGQSNLNRIKFVMILCLLSCILSLVGIILYGSKRNIGFFGNNKNYDWSFVLSTVSGSLFGLIILPLLVEIRQARRLGTYESI